MNEKEYIKLIKKTEIADFYKIKGFLILKPYGYKIWENIKKILNKMLIKSKHENVYLPLLIPKNLFYKKKNIKKNKYAIITHTKFKFNKKKLKIDPKSKLNEEYIIRPTSEDIIWYKYKKWIKTYKDLPKLLNQWANIIRIEMRNKILIRNSEFLWQEGHTAHKNKKSTNLEIKKIKKIYKKLIKKYLSIPFLYGYKTEKEKFYGAKSTYTFETITKLKGKSIQLATIHNLGKNYAKFYNVKYINSKGFKKYVRGTSWGISTRLLGSLIMIHNDKNGLILPPKIAPIQIIIIPIINKKNLKYKNKLKKIIKLITKKLKNKKIRFKYDKNKDETPGYKFYKYERMGVPIRITIGPKEIYKNKIEITRRDNFKKYFLNIKKNYIKKIIKIFKKIQKNIYKIAKKNMYKKIFFLNNYKKFKKKIIKKSGFFIVFWFPNNKNENIIQKETKFTIRCLFKTKKKGKCFYSGKKTKIKAVFGKSY